VRDLVTGVTCVSLRPSWGQLSSAERSPGHLWGIYAPIIARRCARVAVGGEPGKELVTIGVRASSKVGRGGHGHTHNPKVAGSNPAPATKKALVRALLGQGFLLFRARLLTDLLTSSNRDSTGT
jgi:hypothetical protein